MALISVGLEAELSRILLASAWFRRVLEVASRTAPADWLVGGGVIRTLVWDHLHGQAETASGSDVDLVYFDAADLGRTGEAAYEARLRRALPEVDWDVKNQAAVHLWYPQRFGHEIRPIASVEDGVARFPETATAVAVRPAAKDELHVVAPFGLVDLMGMRFKRNPTQVTYDYFLERIASKRVAERWPRVEIEFEA